MCKLVNKLDPRRNRSPESHERVTNSKPQDIHKCNIWLGQSERESFSLFAPNENAWEAVIVQRGLCSTGSTVDLTKVEQSHHL